MNIVTLQSGTTLAELVKLVSRKRKAILRQQNAVVLDGTFWAGGSRSDYFLVHKATKKVTPLARQDPVQFGGVKTAPTQAIEPGYVVIEAGVFCGKPSTPTVYFRSDEQI